MGVRMYRLGRPSLLGGGGRWKINVQMPDIDTHCHIHATDATEYNLSQLLYLGLLFFEAQRSGPLPANNRIPWRRDANVDDAVPGGWYDGERETVLFRFVSLSGFDRRVGR